MRIPRSNPLVTILCSAVVGFAFWILLLSSIACTTRTGGAVRYPYGPIVDPVTKETPHVIIDP